MRNLLICSLAILLGWTATLAAQTTEGDKENPSLRWQNDIDKFLEGDGQKAPPTGEVVFVGSSSIRGWNLGKYFSDRQLINRGFGGSRIEDSTYFADQIVTAYRPKIVVLYAGDNDLATGYSPERVAEDFKQFAAKVHATLPETKVVFIAIKPSIARWKLIDEVRAANRLIARQCKEDDRLAFVDVDTPMIGEDGKPDPQYFVSDGLHLSDAGYRLWASLVEPHLD